MELGIPEEAFCSLCTCLECSVPRLIFLQATEFSGYKAKEPKNGHRNISGLSIILELKFENVKIGGILVIFLFIEAYEKRRSTFTIDIFWYFDF